MAKKLFCTIFGGWVPSDWYSGIALGSDTWHPILQKRCKIFFSSFWGGIKKIFFSIGPRELGRVKRGGNARNLCRIDARKDNCVLQVVRYVGWGAKQLRLHGQQLHDGRNWVRRASAHPWHAMLKDTMWFQTAARFALPVAACLRAWLLQRGKISN